MRQCAKGRLTVRQSLAAGFTLIELLVAVSIMGLLAVVTLTAWRVSTTAYGRTTEYVRSNSRATAVQELIERQIGNMVPVRPWLTRGSINVFFDGRSNGVRFISSYSLRSRTRSGLVAVEYWVQRAGNRWQLVMRERTLGSTQSLGQFLSTDPTTQVGGQPTYIPIGDSGRLSNSVAFDDPDGWLVLVAGLEQCQFEYFVKAASEQESAWKANWSGEAGSLPQAISIRMEQTGEGGEARLQSITSAVQHNQRPFPS